MRAPWEWDQGSALQAVTSACGGSRQPSPMAVSEPIRRTGRPRIGEAEPGAHLSVTRM